MISKAEDKGTGEKGIGMFSVMDYLKVPVFFFLKRSINSKYMSRTRIILATMCVITVVTCYAFYPFIKRCMSFSDRHQAGNVVEDKNKFLSVTPQDRLNQAIAAKDYRFLAIRGYSIEVPGVEEAAIKVVGYVVIPGTSDELLGDADRDFQQNAAKYAQIYNSLLLEKLRALKTLK
jgi:hypothetical protein